MFLQFLHRISTVMQKTRVSNDLVSVRYSFFVTRIGNKLKTNAQTQQTANLFVNLSIFFFT